MIIQAQAQASSDNKWQTTLSCTPGKKLGYGLPPPRLPAEVVPLNVYSDFRFHRTNEVCDDIESVMNSRTPTSAGFFYYVEVHHAAPNPDLEIAGLGPVGIAMSEEEISALISIATPVNHRNPKSVVKTEDPDVSNSGCWEIGPDKLTFTNPLWNRWINETQLNICGNLRPESLYVDSDSGEESDEDDAMPEDTLPKIILRSLRIWRPCVEQSPVFGISKAGSFATMTVILPSEYSAGQTTLSHGPTTRTIDLSPDSGQSTSIMAWQNDVQFKTRNIASGFRLALTYDVFLPPDSLPSILSETGTFVDKLSIILRKWSRGTYKTVPPYQFAAHLFQNYYPDDVLLNKGEMCLSGDDRQELAIIQDAAVRSGFIVCLTNIRYSESGSSFPRDEGEFYLDGTPKMDEVFHRGTRIGPIFVYPDGNCLADLSLEFPLEHPGTIMPVEYEELLQELEPTDKKLDEHNPKSRGTLHISYRRTAVVFFRADLKDDITWKLGGIPGALKQLHGEDQGQPSDAEKTWAGKILREIENRNNSNWNLKEDGALKLVDCALSWKDIEIWRRLTESSGYCSIRVLGCARLLRAWKTFGFANITNSFQKILGRSSSTTAIPEKLAFFNMLVQDASAGEMDEICRWCRTMIKALLSHSWELTLDLAPVVVKVLQSIPIQWFKHYTFPNILNANSVVVMTSLVEALRENEEVIVQRQLEIDQSPSRLFAKSDPFEGTSRQSSSQDPVLPATSATWLEAVRRLELKCLLRAAQQWDVPEPEDPRRQHNSWEKPPTLPLDMPPRIRMLSIERILKVIDLAIRAGNRQEEVCKYLFAGILKSPGASDVKFIELYIPLMAPLRDLLQKQNQAVYSPPFAEYFQSVIAKYLSDLLGNKSEARNHRLRRVGCGCRDCQCLDSFMLDPLTSEQLYEMPKKRREHFEHMLSKFSPDLCTFETVVRGRPGQCSSMLVKKLPEVVGASTWDGRVSEAVEFLKSVGTDEEVSRIMGDKFLDVKDALAGIRPFVVSAVAVA